MKKVLLLVAALTMIATAATAGPVAYIGVFADAAHSVITVNNPGGFYPWTLHTWVLPSDNGAMCAEYKVVAPVNVIVSTATTNPGATVDMGSPVGAPGASICFGTCQNDWFWTYQVLMYLTDTTPTWVELFPHDDAGGPQVANCEEGYPIEPATKYTLLGLNQDGIVANDKATWGAIKSLINE